ncbi:MAG TPA: PAS domain S-box protein [Methylomirabilota bacterium]|nr:PAS domain S-box protein [Methylomirabilota bacterium]
MDERRNDGYKGRVTSAATLHDLLCRQIVEQMPDAVIFADRDGVVRLWNRAAETVFGYSADEALGQSLDLIIPERFRARHWDGYARVMETGTTRYGTRLLAVPAMRKDGQRISIEFSIALLKDERGRVTGAAAIVRDVTARWHEERELRQRLAALEESARGGRPAPGGGESPAAP